MLPASCRDGFVSPSVDSDRDVAGRRRHRRGILRPCSSEVKLTTWLHPTGEPSFRMSRIGGGLARAAAVAPSAPHGGVHTS